MHADEISIVMNLLTRGKFYRRKNCVREYRHLYIYIRLTMKMSKIMHFKCIRFIITAYSFTRQSVTMAGPTVTDAEVRCATKARYRFIEITSDTPFVLWQSTCDSQVGASVLLMNAPFI